jgi:hypothetical protein
MPRPPTFNSDQLQELRARAITTPRLKAVDLVVWAEHEFGIRTSRQNIERILPELGLWRAMNGKWFEPE